MLALLHRVLRRIKALHHGLHGRLAWRCGSAARARYHFERVLALGGCNFSAYVHLGRIALGEGDYAGYRRELGNARACDPDRFTRLRIPTWGLEQRTAGTPFEETAKRATWRSVRSGCGPSRRPTVHSAELPTDLGVDNVNSTLSQQLEDLVQSLDDPGPQDWHRDDFCSPVERARFRHLPPIDSDEVQHADIDEIMRRFDC